MLDRAKLLQALNGVADHLFTDISPAYATAFNMWKRICQDPSFRYKIHEINAPWPLPSWSDELGTVISVDSHMPAYTAISVDGSQIYPDRHQGNACFLINIGSVLVHYGGAEKPVQLDSVPYVYTGNDQGEYDVGISPHELVNCRRQEQELAAGLELSEQHIQAMQRGALLFDGSLIFWHLEAKNPVLHELFFEKYIALLHQLYDERIPMAGYISLPKSRELVNLVRVALCDFNMNNLQAAKAVDCVVDATLLNAVLQPYTRTIVFKNNAAVSAQYPSPLQPHFFYLHVGTEIGRVEIPAWVARDAELVDNIARILLDQCIKGRGYPVVLAEAHEQAVVKGPDREFFYHVLYKIGMTRRRPVNLSQKVIKKRGIGI